MRGWKSVLGATAAIVVGAALPGVGPEAVAGQAPLALEGSAAPTPWKRYKDWNNADWSSFNDLAHPDRSPKAPEPGQLRDVKDPGKGDPAKGQQLAFSRARGGGCLSCHVMGPGTPEMPGNAGPDLSEIGTWGRSDLELFNRIWDPRVFNPETAMPPWGAHGYYNEQEIRDMVAFLQSLKTPAKFSNALDDPRTRPLPKEDRDWTDPFVNPSAELIETGHALFRKAGPAGKSCASCHADPATAFKGWAARMPYYEERLDKVLGVAEFVTRHAAATTGAQWLMQSPENTALVVYLTNLSAGMPVAVDVSSPAAKAAYARGEAMTRLKIGQQHMACVDCHGKFANTWLRGQYLGELKGQTAHFPLWRTSRLETWDIRKRLQWCGVQIRSNELPPDAREYGDLELYLTALSNQVPIEAPNIRH